MLEGVLCLEYEATLVGGWVGVGEWRDGSGWRWVTKGRWMGELYE